MGKQLPEILREIASVVGHASMLKLVRSVGGTRVYIPANPQTGHWLIKAIGNEAAVKLGRHFAIGGTKNDSSRGQRIEIPILVGGLYRESMKAIEDQIASMDSQKQSSRKIARTIGVTQRTVHRHRSARAAQ